MIRVSFYSHTLPSYYEEDTKPYINSARDFTKEQLKNFGERRSEGSAPSTTGSTSATEKESKPTSPSKPTSSPEATSNSTTAQTKDALNKEKTTIEVKDLQKKVGQQAAETKLQNLDTSLRVMMTSSPKLLGWLESSGADVLGEVDKLGEVFTRVAESYVGLEKNEAQRFANGIVASLIDSLTHQANKDQATLDGEKKEKESSGTDSKDSNKEKKSTDIFGSWFDIAGEIAGIFGSEKDGGALTGQLQALFKPLMQVFGALAGVDILSQRLKSIWLIIELTRKAKETFVQPGQPLSSCQWLSRDQSVINHPQRFVGSVRYIEKAIKANKELIKPEYMTTKDFNAMVQINDKQGSSQFSLLELLGLKNVDKTSTLIADKPFADLDENVNNDIMSDPKVAKSTAASIVQGLSIATAQGSSLVHSRGDRDTEWKSLLGKKGDKVLDLFAKVSDPKDPNSLYSTVMKSINLIRGLLTGKSFTHDTYDKDAESKLGGSITSSPEIRASDDQEITLGSENIHIGRRKQAIFANESLGTDRPYWAINPESTALGKYQFLMSDNRKVTPWLMMLRSMIDDKSISLLSEADPQYSVTKAFLDKHTLFKDYSSQNQQLLITYMTNADLQEDFMNIVMNKSYLPSLEKFSQLYGDQIKKNNLNASELMMGIHFLGEANMKLFLEQGRDALSDTIKGKNKNWDEYIKTFRSAYH